MIIKGISITNKWNKYFVRNTWVSLSDWQFVSGGYQPRWGASSGTQNTALHFGGNDQLITYMNLTYKFNGRSWSATGNLITARHSLAGAGVQNAALSIAGFNGSALLVCEKFNGSSWISTAGIGLVTYQLAGAGTQNAALSFGGYSGLVYRATVQRFNGSSWSVAGSLNTARSFLAGSGTQNAALSFGGRHATAALSIVEKYNGTVWLVGSLLNTARRELAGSGTQNAALSFGGTNDVSYYATTEKYNGDNWKTMSAYLFGGIAGNAGTGTGNSALSIAGYNSIGQTAAVQKFLGELPYNIHAIARSSYYYIETLSINSVIPVIGLPSLLQCEVLLDFNTGITEEERIDIVSLEKLDLGDSGVWSTAASLNVARHQHNGSGSPLSALCSGGRPGTNGYNEASAEKYNGATWSLTGSLNQGRSSFGGCGLQNSTIVFSGVISSSFNTRTTEKFNGSVWFYSADMNAERPVCSGAGVQNAALSMGSFGDFASEKFDGNTWSISGSTTQYTLDPLGTGSQNSALCCGGRRFTPIAYFSKVEKFNGAVWSLHSNMTQTRCSGSAAGTSTFALAIGWGTTERLMSIFWFVTAAMVSSREYVYGSGMQSNAIGHGGFSISPVVTCEVYSTQMGLPFVGILADIIVV